MLIVQVPKRKEELKEIWTIGQTFQTEVKNPKLLLQQLEALYLK